MESLYKIFSLTCVCFCFQCNSQKLNHQSVSNDFLKWTLQNREENIIYKTPIKLGNEIFQILDNEIKLSQQDSISIQKQLIKSSNSDFEDLLFPSKKFVGDSELKKMTEKGTYLYIKISRPLFFDNKILIVIEQYCGINCGSGQILVYERENFKYNLLLRKLTWIS